MGGHRVPWHDADAWPRRKHAQAMRTESVRVEGSRWNRPCYYEGFCTPYTPCVCERHPIVRMRSRCCNRVACSFMKWCRSIPSREHESPPWRTKWACDNKLVYLPMFLRGYPHPFT